MINPEEGAIRVAMFAAMAALMVAALCVPQALGDYALGFAVAYGVVRFAQIALYLLASRTDHELRRSVVGLAVGTTIGVGIILGAAFAPPGWREALWVLALVLDFGEPAVFGISGWRLSPAHFAERHGLIIIIALGESIVALGIASEVDLTAGVITAAVLGVALASALWWTYFDVVALVTARRLVQAPEGAVRNALARNSYSYLHLPMVAGIVLVALGLESTIAHVDDELHAYTAFALLGGVAIYLLAHVVLRWQNAHTLNRQRFALAIVLLALIPVGDAGPCARHGGGGERAHLGDDRLRAPPVRRAPLPVAPRPRCRHPRRGGRGSGELTGGCSSTPVRSGARACAMTHPRSRHRRPPADDDPGGAPPARLRPARTP